MLLKEPNISDYFIYTEGADWPDFIPPAHEFPIQKLPRLLKYYADAADRALTGNHLPTPGRPGETAKKSLIEALVNRYNRVYDDPPTQRHDSGFHKVVILLLKRAGYKTSGDKSNIENSIRSAIKSLPPL